MMVEGMQFLLEDIKKTETMARKYSIEETDFLTDQGLNLEAIDWMSAAQNINERYAGAYPF